MAHTTTWEPWNGDGPIPATAYAFPRQRVEPLTDAIAVSDALERFDLYAVTDEDRTEAFLNIKKAANHFHLELHGETYEEICRRPQELMTPRD